jgi:hypothetical protein
MASLGRRAILNRFPATLPLGSTQKHFRRGHLADYWGSCPACRHPSHAGLLRGERKRASRQSPHYGRAHGRLGSFPTTKFCRMNRDGPAVILTGGVSLCPAGASGQAGFGIRAGKLAFGGS